MALKIPTVHLNGTSYADLLDQTVEASQAICVVMDVLAQAAPNARDYYPQGDGAYKEAEAQHRKRLMYLQAILVEYQALAEGISKQEKR